MEAFPWFTYVLLVIHLILGLFGVQPRERRRHRGFSITSLTGRERGYSLASQGHGEETNEDIEMTQRS